MIREDRHITLAYFDKVSTVDYIGAVQGIPVCFDAKECKTDTFPLANVHEHQIQFMQKFEEQGGIAFLLIYYHDKGMSCTICGTGKYKNFGIVRKTAAEKVFDLMNWSQIGLWN